MSEFPFLRLPLLNLKNVLEMLELLDLLRLARCNKKLRGIIWRLKQIKSNFLPVAVKQSMGTLDLLELFQLQWINAFPEFLCFNPILFNLCVHPANIGVQFCMGENEYKNWIIYTENIARRSQFVGPRSYVDIGVLRVPVVVNSSHQLFTFWKDRLEGLKTLVGWLMRNYSFRFETLYICKGIQRDCFVEVKSIINFVNYRQQAYTNCIIDEMKEQISEENLNFIAENVRFTNDYTRLSYNNGAIKYIRNCRQSTLYLNHARFFTMDHLLAAKFAFIQLIRVEWTQRELCSFVRNWIQGSCKYLKHLLVESAYLRTCRDLTTGFREYITSVTPVGVYKTMKELYNPIFIGANITTQNGAKRATINNFQNHRNDRNQGHTVFFDMMIWPDFDGLGHDRNPLQWLEDIEEGIVL